VKLDNVRDAEALISAVGLNDWEVSAEVLKDRPFVRDPLRVFE
jgi:hypothetical protein